MHKALRIVFAMTVLAIAGSGAPAAMADTPAAPMGAVNRTQTQALPHVAELLQLMDTDANGRVSKQEFMRFMEAQFDLADTNNDGELDPKEVNAFLRSLYRRPSGGPHR